MKEQDVERMLWALEDKIYALRNDDDIDRFAKQLAHVNFLCERRARRRSMFVGFIAAIVSTWILGVSLYYMYDLSTAISAHVIIHSVFCIGLAIFDALDKGDVLKSIEALEYRMLKDSSSEE